MSDARLRLRVVGEEVHPLHWSMLSWLVVGFCVRVFRVFRRECLAGDIRGGRILCASREGLVGVLGEQSVRVMVVLCWRVFLGGIGVSACGVGYLW